jgi:predicted nucleic acid-binding protein
MKVFYDTSAFIKLFQEEFGSDKITELRNEATVNAVSIICMPETFSTLNRLRREKKFDMETYKLIKREFLEELNSFFVCDLGHQIIKDSIGIIEKNPLKGMDSIHVSTAMKWKADKFVSGDKQQLKSAKANGLNVVSIT